MTVYDFIQVVNNRINVLNPPHNRSRCWMLGEGEDELKALVGAGEAKQLFPIHDTGVNGAQTTIHLLLILFPHWVVLPLLPSPRWHQF